MTKRQAKAILISVNKEIMTQTAGFVALTSVTNPEDVVVSKGNLQAISCAIVVEREK